MTIQKLKLTTPITILKCMDGALSPLARHVLLVISDHNMALT